MLRYATVKVRENPQNFRVFNKGETPLETGYCEWFEMNEFTPDVLK